MSLHKMSYIKRNIQSYLAMFLIIILSGLIARNIQATSINSIHISLSDLYYVLLLSGLMFFFVGLYHRIANLTIFGTILVTINVLLIRR